MAEHSAPSASPALERDCDSDVRAMNGVSQMHSATRGFDARAIDNDSQAHSLTCGSDVCAADGSSQIRSTTCGSDVRAMNGASQMHSATCGSDGRAANGAPQVRVGAELAQPARLQDFAANVDAGRPGCRKPMSNRTARILSDLNTRFYAEQAASFSATRHGLWAGWNKALAVAGISSAPVRVVDVACGNMRFESYLAERFPDEPHSYIGVDNCPDLVAVEGKVLEIDADSNRETPQVCVGAPLVAPAGMQGASTGNTLADPIDCNAPSCDVTLSGAAPVMESKNAAGKASCDVILSGVAPATESKNATGKASCDVILSGGRRPESKNTAGIASCDVTLSGVAPATESKNAAAKPSCDVILSEARSAESKNLVGENAGSQVSSTFLNRDFVDLLLNNNHLDLPTGDLVVCFGFMHHVPGAVNRQRFLAELLATVAPGGTLVVSFWQFMAVPGIASQAAELTEPALEALGLALDDVEPGDFILGWQNSPTARRYCHSFTADEVRSLASAAASQVAAAFDFTFFEADGRNRRLNCYLVARRREGVVNEEERPSEREVFA